MSVVPVLVTVTTDEVLLAPTRLKPKSKLVSLREAVERAGVIASVAADVWLRVPDAPETVTAIDGLTVAPEAVSMNCPTWPGVRLRVAGEAVTPAGRPLTETLTLPVNELTDVTETERA